MGILSIIPVIGSLLDKILPDKAAADKAKAELEAMALKGDLDNALQQIAVNVEEAKSSSVFVSGARPFIMWICGGVICYHFLLLPIIMTLSTIFGFDVSILPKFDLEALWPVITGLLGLGAYRTVEKVNGVARK